jgi:ABC-2 type transport system ATP-binding protein
MLSWHGGCHPPRSVQTTVAAPKSSTHRPVHEKSIYSCVALILSAPSVRPEALLPVGPPADFPRPQTFVGTIGNQGLHAGAFAGLPAYQPALWSRDNLGVIQVRGLSKRFGDVVAVDHLSFDVRPGTVTGFLGPNGSGKSTTMRMVMGLDVPNSGSATVLGQPYHDLPWPLREVGGLLEAKAIHPGRSARSHLLTLARSNGIPRTRVDEVLELVGLTSVASKRAGKFSLGMGQRLGIAAALLGDPGVLLFDEPVNGLDPEGIRWVRTLCKRLAGEGRTVFVSSHLMAEMALTADHLVVIGKGKLIAETSVADFVARSSRQSVKVRTPAPHQLSDAVTNAGGTVIADPDGSMTVTGLSAPEVGDLAASLTLALHELTPVASLEDAFMELTEEAVEFRGGQ